MQASSLSFVKLDTYCIKICANWMFVFYGISTLGGYLMLNPVDANIKYI